MLGGGQSGAAAAKRGCTAASSRSSLTAAVPTLLVVAMAAFLFQSGMNSWFSERSRGMFENAISVAQNFFESEKRDVGANTLAMATDLRGQMARAPIESPEFYDFYVQQVVVRELSESAIIEVGTDGIARTVAAIDPDNRAAENRLPPATIRRLMTNDQLVTSETRDGVEAAVRLLPERRVFLYAARGQSLLGFESVQRARSVFADYNALFSRSRALQFRFMLALYLGAVALIALVVVVAIVVADRIVRPIEELVGAAQCVAAGDLEVRVSTPDGRPDEIARLADAFNQMTSRLGQQTSALVRANEQNEGRRQFIEAVLSGVTAGIVSLDADGHIRLANAAAARMLRRKPEELAGASLHDITPELSDWIDDPHAGPILEITLSDDPRTWAVKIVSDDDGHVVTFEDITQQLFDQRRAAWSDVARRIAHEIKNPLTPIQLAAERLQRRFSRVAGDDLEIFSKLTSTIVRQVGDLRRMVDEFSSFARMPKPLFKQENVADILRQTVFLHEVSKPDIQFDVVLEDALPLLVCDRRLLAQAFTNLIKNAVEAIERSDRKNGVIACAIRREGDGIRVEVSDNGVGLSLDRSKIVEPYVTTREGGTGLGLAIVKRIVEEHSGELNFGDVPGGGTMVTLHFPGTADDEARAAVETEDASSIAMQQQGAK